MNIGTEQELSQMTNVKFLEGIEAVVTTIDILKENALKQNYTSAAIAFNDAIRSMEVARTMINANPKN